MRAIWAIILLALAGCAGPAVDNKGPRDPLDDHRECKFYFPDGSPVPCLPNDRLEAAASGAPPGWLCSLEITGPGFRVATYWHPIEDRYAFSYDFRDEPDYPYGVASLSAAEPKILVWESPGREAFVELPSEVSQGDLVIDLYTLAVVESGGLLANASVQALWSQYETNTWLVQRVEAGDTFFFMRMEEYFRDASRSFYGARGVYLSTPDYKLSVDYRHSGGFGIPLQGAGTCDL